MTSSERIQLEARVSALRHEADAIERQLRDAPRTDKRRMRRRQAIVNPSDRELPTNASALDDRRLQAAVRKHGFLTGSD